MGTGVTSDPTVSEARTWRGDSSGSTLVRLGLVGVWLLAAAAVLVVGERPATVEDLLDGVRAGRVAEVHVAGTLPPGASGVVAQDVRWRRAGIRRHAEVLLATPGDEDRVTTGSEVVLTEDVASLVHRLDPEVRVVVGRDRAPVNQTVLGWGVPGWLHVGVLGALVLTLGLVVSGKEPWRATRWAWAWWVLFTGPVGAFLFAVLSGPTPLVPAPRPGARRLTGGWGLLLAILLGGLLTGSP